MKSISMRPFARFRGFTLLEVMIAVVVLATGMLALTALQGALARSSADAKARSQIAAYATSELDRLRTGTVGDADDIAASIADTAQAAGLATLTRDIDSTQYVYDETANSGLGAFVPSTDPPEDKAYFNRHVINVGWTDATGATRTLSMTTDVSPLALNSSKVLVDREPNDDAGLRPIVRRESPLTEGMIPIATGGGDGESTAATNPKPTLKGGEDGTYVSDTRFDVLTYSRDEFTPENFVRFNKRIETAVVGCSCQDTTAGFNDQDNFQAFQLAQGFRPTYWDGTAYKVPEAAGTAVDSSPSDVSQSELCDVCCRDHKDLSTAAGPKFSPWEGQIAEHKLLDGGEYLEACRVIRVDGVFRVSADPMIQDNALVATLENPASSSDGQPVANNTAATSPLLSDPGTAAYERYVYDGVSSLFYSSASVAAEGNATDFAAIQQDSGLNEPTYVPILPGERRWLHGRVLMTDYLEAEAIDKIRNTAEDCESPSGAVQQAQCVLPFVPMATINTTEISFWSPRATNDADQLPSEVEGIDPRYLNYAKSGILPHNSGLALFSALPGEDDAAVEDEQLFVQLSEQPPAEPDWLSTPSPNPETARLFGDPEEPMRGYAQAAAPHEFDLSWLFPTGNPKSPVSDANLSNDPSAEVNSGGFCESNDGTSTLAPYTCTSAVTTDVRISLAGYNRIETSRENNPCPDAANGAKVDRPVCVTYEFEGASLTASNEVFNATDIVITGTGVNQEATFTMPSITQSGGTVNAEFINGLERAASYECPTGATEPVWEANFCE